MDKTRIIRNRHLPFMEIKTGAETAYSVKKHSHEELSLGFVEKGSSTILCRSLELKLQIDDVVLIPPRTVHLCQPSDPDLFRFTMVFLDPHWLQKSFGLTVHGIRALKASLTGPYLEAKTGFLNRFESGEDGLEQETRALLFVGKILLDIFGLDPEAKAGDQDLPGNLQKIKSFLDRRFTGDIRLEDLEKICRRNKFSIIRDFSRAYDLTPHAYVLDRRINLARTLLLKDRSVADTAAECGFFDQSHFIKTFKKFTGINPAQYKNSR